VGTKTGGTFGLILREIIKCGIKFCEDISIIRVSEIHKVVKLSSIFKCGENWINIQWLYFVWLGLYWWYS